MRRRNVVWATVAISLGLGTATVITIGGALNGSRNGYLGRDGYRVIPARWLAYGEMRFTQLSRSQAARVRVSASSAEHTAKIDFAHDSAAHVVFESLGGYIDVNQIVPDWVGTQAWIPPVRPAYFIRLAGVDIPATGRRIGFNHHVDVVVSAITGREICAVSFD